MAEEAALCCASTLRRLVAERPDELVYWHVGHDGHELAFSWSAIDQRSSQIAAGLLTRGARFGDRVSIGLKNSPQFTFGPRLASGRSARSLCRCAGICPSGSSIGSET